MNDRWLTGGGWVIVGLSVLWFPAIAAGPAVAQAPGAAEDDAPAEVTVPDTSDTLDEAKRTAKDIADQAEEKIGELAEAVDADDRANEAKENVLSWIYQLAEQMSFPAFHWLAFAAMVAGVVSFGLQLVLGKLVVLTRLGLSVTEILSDALGLVISLVGLVLTTQAASENSNFTQSASAVLSAAAVGGVVGFVFYLWGQRQELQAVKGRTENARDD